MNKKGFIAAALVAILVLLTAVNAEKNEKAVYVNNAGMTELLDTARVFFYRAIEDEKVLPRAFSMFEKIEKQYPALIGRTTTYRGALTAVKAKHAFWPHSKLSYANEGLDIMDEGRRLAPNDIESLFVHASTCYYLPFFFGRGSDAEETFVRLAELIPIFYKEYNPSLMYNVVSFLLEKAKLPTGKKNTLLALQKELEPYKIEQ